MDHVARVVLVGVLVLVMAMAVVVVPTVAVGGMAGGGASWVALRRLELV